MSNTNVQTHETVVTVRVRHRHSDDNTSGARRSNTSQNNKPDTDKKEQVTRVEIRNNNNIFSSHNGKVDKTELQTILQSKISIFSQDVVSPSRVKEVYHEITASAPKAEATTPVQRQSQQVAVISKPQPMEAEKEERKKMVSGLMSNIKDQNIDVKKYGLPENYTENDLDKMSAEDFIKLRNATIEDDDKKMSLDKVKTALTDGSIDLSKYGLNKKFKDKQLNKLSAGELLEIINTIQAQKPEGEACTETKPTGGTYQRQSLPPTGSSYAPDEISSKGGLQGPSSVPPYYGNPDGSDIDGTGIWDNKKFETDDKKFDAAVQAIASRIKSPKLKEAFLSACKWISDQEKAAKDPNGDKRLQNRPGGKTGSKTVISEQQIKRLKDFVISHKDSLNIQACAGSGNSTVAYASGENNIRYHADHLNNDSIDRTIANLLHEMGHAVGTSELTEIGNDETLAEVFSEAYLDSKDKGQFSSLRSMHSFYNAHQRRQGHGRSSYGLALSAIA